MPWKDPKRLDAHKKEMLRGKVDQLPLVTSSENDSATPPGDSESKSDSYSSATNRRDHHADKCYVTTVTVTTSATPTLPRALKPHEDNPSHRIYRLSHHESPSPLATTSPIISYEKNKSVRIVVKEPTVDASSPTTHGKRRSRPLEDGVDDDVVTWRTSLEEKDRDVNNWVANQHKPPPRHEFTTTKEKLQDEEGVKVRPLLETTWRSSSRASVLDEPPSSDDCQRSTSTLVNTNSSKVGKSTNECQRGCLALLCGVSVVVGSAVCLRLPGLLLTFGPGSFLTAFIVCLLFVAAPLAYLECGLAQFSNNSVIGVWSLVPLARGIGWSTVVACLYWGATTAGLAAPWFHYVIEENDPSILQVPNECRLRNGSAFDAVYYYRSCVYNISSGWEAGLDLGLTWTLPAGLITILMLSSVSVAGGPALLALISVTGSILALTGCGVQLYIAVSEIRLREEHFVKSFLLPLLRVFIPDPQTLTKPQVWIAAMSQALLCLGPGVGMLLNHSANNIFRHPLKRHLWTLISLTILSTILVTVTTILEVKIFTDYYAPARNPFDVLEVSGDENDTYFSQPSLSLQGFNDCIFYSDPENQQNGFSDFSCLNVAPGLVKGIPFILSSHMTSSSMEKYPAWLSTILTNLIFVGFLGAGGATSCVCMHVGVVAAREARSLPPAVAAIILMGVLSLVAAPMSTQAGASLIQLVDHDVLTPGLLWPSFATLISLAIWHGVHKIRKDMTFMLESAVSWIWLPVWAVFLPLVFLGLTIWTFVIDWRELGMVEEPNWRIAVVWSLRLGLLVAMPVTAIIVINSQLAYGFKDKVLSSLQSSREWGDWGPQDPIEHHNWRRWREDETQSYASLERRLASKSRPLTYTHSTLSSSSSSTLARLRAKYRGQTQACDL